MVVTLWIVILQCIAMKGNRNGFKDESSTNTSYGFIGVTIICEWR